METIGITIIALVLLLILIIRAVTIPPDILVWKKVVGEDIIEGIVEPHSKGFRVRVDRNGEPLRLHGFFSEESQATKTCLKYKDLKYER